MSSNSYKFCENCGTRNGPTGKFCSQCGEPLDPPVGPTIPPYRPLNHEKLQSREGSKSSIIITTLSLFVVILLVSVGVLAFHQLNQANPSGKSISITQVPSIGSTATPTQPQVVLSRPTVAPTSSSISWSSSHTDTSGGRSALTISGSAILEGDDTVNGAFQGDGLAKEGTLIVLLDSTQYAIRSDNQGTEWVPVGGTPTRPQIETEVGSIVDQMKGSKDTCSGGCTSVKVVYFQGGQVIDTKTL